VRPWIKTASVALVIVSIVGLVVSIIMNGFVLDKFDAYGEVPIPGTRTLHLPAGDVTVDFHSRYPKGADTDQPIPIPEDLEVTITPPNGVAEPTATESNGHDCGANTDNGDGHCTVRVAHIPQAGDYVITTNANVTPSVNPRLAFGHRSQFDFLTWLFGGLLAVSVVAMIWAMRPRELRPATPGPPLSAADELEQRRQNWAAIDSLVREFIPEAIRRETTGPWRRRWREFADTHWVVQSAQHERDLLGISKNGSWGLYVALNSGYLELVTLSSDPEKQGPRETYVVDGLRQGARRVLNTRSVRQ
jgi:hypothetical protein